MRIHIMAVAAEDRYWRSIWLHFGPMFGRLLKRELSLEAAIRRQGEGAPGLYIIPYNPERWRTMAEWLACWRELQAPAPVIVVGDVPERRQKLLKVWGVATTVQLDADAAAAAVGVLTSALQEQRNRRRNTVPQAKARPRPLTPPHLRQKTKPNNALRAATCVGMPRRAPSTPMSIPLDEVQNALYAPTC